jgi:hypothetical protein
MSTSLYWTPPPSTRKEYNIGSLKYEFAKMLGEYDGSCSENLGLVGKEIVPYLDGIIAGNGNGDMARDAQKLKEAIEKYDQVELIIHS